MKILPVLTHAAKKQQFLQCPVLKMVKAQQELEGLLCEQVEDYKLQRPNQDGD
jgi:hypothetical protein